MGFMSSILCSRLSIFPYWLQGKTPFVSQCEHGICRVTSKRSHTHRTLTYHQDHPQTGPDPWVCRSPHTPDCVWAEKDGYWWFDIDSRSNVTLENVFLIEDSVNDIEFSSRSRFYTDVHMASDNCLPFLRSLHPYVGQNQVLSSSIGIYYWDPPMLKYALSPKSL